MLPILSTPYTKNDYTSSSFGLLLRAQLGIDYTPVVQSSGFSLDGQVRLGILLSL